MSMPHRRLRTPPPTCAPVLCPATVAPRMHRRRSRTTSVPCSTSRNMNWTRVRLQSHLPPPPRSAYLQTWTPTSHRRRRHRSGARPLRRRPAAPWCTVLTWAASRSALDRILPMGTSVLQAMLWDFPQLFELPTPPSKASLTPSLHAIRTPTFLPRFRAPGLIPPGPVAPVPGQHARPAPRPQTRHHAGHGRVPPPLYPNGPPCLPQ
jgi:hypothetical protein